MDRQYQFEEPEAYRSTTLSQLLQLSAALLPLNRRKLAGGFGRQRDEGAGTGNGSHLSGAAN